MPMQKRLWWTKQGQSVTDTKTLWGEDPDKRNLCSASICLNHSHFRVQSYLYLQFLHYISYISYCQSQPISRNNSPSGVFKKKFSCWLLKSLSMRKNVELNIHVKWLQCLFFCVYNPAIPWVNGLMLEAKLHCRKKLAEVYVITPQCQL